MDDRDVVQPRPGWWDRGAEDPEDPEDDDPGRPFLPAEHEAGDVRRLLAEGLLRPLLGGVVVAAHAPDAVALRARGALVALAARLGGTPSGRGVRGTPVLGFAAAVWVHAGGSPPEDVDVVIAPGSTRPRRGLRVHEHRLADRDVVRVEGLPVTTVERTGADVARGYPLPMAHALLDLLADRAGLTAMDVIARLDAMPRARGVNAARDVVLAWAAVVASRR